VCIGLTAALTPYRSLPPQATTYSTLHLEKGAPPPPDIVYSKGLALF